MRVLVIDTEVSNLQSVVTAIHALGFATEIISYGWQLWQAPRRPLIFPGVGEARATMRSLVRRGIDGALHRFVARGGAVLGICVGAQLLLERSEEGDTVGLGIVRGTSRRVADRSADGARLKVPHMGWNAVHARVGSPLFAGIGQRRAFYFVHSYYTVPARHSERIAWCEYGHTLSVGFAAGHVFGVQFHPEKSGRHGLQLLRNFIGYGLARMGGHGAAGAAVRQVVRGVPCC